MKVLSDFDGVITNQIEEGERVQSLFRERIIAVTGILEDDLDRLFNHAHQRLSADPTAYGWRSQQRITAFADEDLFVQNIGLADCLDIQAAAGDADILALQAALLSGEHKDFSEVAGWSYFAMVEETRNGKMEPMEQSAADVLTELIEGGIDVVVVSNSSTARVLKLLRGSGLNAIDHAIDPTAKLRVRGDARKFDLGSAPQAISVGQHRCDIDRPAYLTILKEEQPDIVIGDVFSLDLALPLYLAQSDAEFKGLKALLRTRSYTPKWSVKGIEEDRWEGATSALLPDFSELIKHCK